MQQAEEAARLENAEAVMRRNAAQLAERAARPPVVVEHPLWLNMLNPAGRPGEAPDLAAALAGIPPHRAPRPPQRPRPPPARRRHGRGARACRGSACAQRHRLQHHVKDSAQALLPLCAANGTLRVLIARRQDLARMRCGRGSGQRMACWIGLCGLQSAEAVLTLTSRLPTAVYKILLKGCHLI